MIYTSEFLKNTMQFNFFEKSIFKINLDQQKERLLKVKHT